MRKSYKVIFLGSTSVGKTTLISQYLYKRVQSATPTIGIDFLSTSLEIDGKSVRLQLWDTAGQERFQSIIGNYTRNTFIAVMVYAINDPQSLDKVDMWVNNFVYTHNDKKDVRLLIVGNKNDMAEESFDPDMSKATAIAEALDAKLVSASALSTEGIRDVSEAINEFIKEDLEKRGDSDDDDDEQLNILAATPRSGRCC